MIRVILSNLEATGFSSQAGVMQGDVRRLVPALHRQGEMFDIVFVDPPYGHGLAPLTLDILLAHNVLESDGIIVVRHEIRQEMPEDFGDLELARQEKYGDTIISFYTFER